MKLLAEQTLFECLDLLEEGESVEQILARYPESADVIRPFLTTAVRLSQRTSQPTLAAKQKSEQRFLQRAAELRAAAAAPSPWIRLRRTLMPLASLAMVLFIVGAAVITASASALPGDTLYGTKRLFEELRLTRTGDSGDIEALTEQIQEERIREVESILRTDRDVPVAFEGAINTIQADSWLIADIQVQVDRFTRIKGTPKTGSLARVNGRTHDGIFRAVSITILSNNQPPLETPDEPEPTDTPTPSPTPIPTTTPPVPTETPSPNDNSSDDNINDNDDDNINDNDDDNANDNDDDNANNNSGDDNANNSGDDNANDNSGNDNANDNSGNDDASDNSGNDDANDNANDNSGNDSANDNSGNDNANDNSGNDNANDNSGNDNVNDNSGNDNANDNSGNDNANDNSGNDNSGNDNANDNSGNDNANDNSGNDNLNNNDNGNSGSGNGNNNDNNDDNGNDNGGSGNSGSGNGNNNDNDNDDS